MKEFFRKVTGIIGAVGIGFGLLFRLQHYPGATVVLLGGMVFRVLQFLLTPADFRTFSPFGSIRKNQSKVVRILQGISIAIIIVGALFKIQHYPGGSVLTIIGWLLLTIVMVIKASQNLQKETTEIDISDFGKKES